MLWLRIQNTPHIWKVNMWVGRENLFFSFKGYCSATKSFCMRRKLLSAARHNTTDSFIWAQSDSGKGKKKNISGKKSHIQEYTRHNPPRWPFPVRSYGSTWPQPPSPLHPSGPTAEVKDWWSWRLSGNLANRTGLRRPLPWLPHTASPALRPPAPLPRGLPRTLSCSIQPRGACLSLLLFARDLGD